MSSATTAPEFGPNDWFVEEKYHQFLADPNSVEPIWRDFFTDPVAEHRQGLAAGGQDTSDSSAVVAPAAPPAQAAAPAPVGPSARPPASPAPTPSNGASNGGSARSPATATAPDPPGLARLE